jgi:hypothetical protein
MPHIDAQCDVTTGHWGIRAWLPACRGSGFHRKWSFVGEIGSVAGSDEIALFGEELRLQHPGIGDEHSFDGRPAQSDSPVAVSVFEAIDIAASDELSCATVSSDQYDNDVAFRVSGMAIDFARVSGDVVKVRARGFSVCCVGPSTVLGAEVDLIAMLIDTITVVCRGDEVYIVPVAPSGMTRDAVQNRRAVHQVMHVLL